MSSSCKVMSEASPMMPSGPSRCSSSSLAARVDLSVVPTTVVAREEDEDWKWESDWVSEWESDWESACGKKNAPAAKEEDYDSQNEILRVKSMKTLTGNDSPGRIPQTKRRGSRPAAEDVVEVHDDDDDDTNSDSDSEESDAPRPACHYCRLRNSKKKVQCSRCPIRLCGLCLQARNGEQLEIEIQEGVKWVCPKCRAGCGPGCNNCCTCAPCRKIQGLAPAGRVIQIAKQVGFDNVHDYLIHRQTGESRVKIAQRKEGTGWTKAGGATSSWSRGENTAKLKPGQFRTTDYLPTSCGGVELRNQTKGLPWTIPKAMGDILTSTNNNLKPGGGKPRVAILPLGNIAKLANGMDASKFKNDERKGPVDERKKVLDQVLGREAQKPVRAKLSLDQIVNILLQLEDKVRHDRSGPQLGSMQQIRRNRKHRKMDRILEDSMFSSCKSRIGNATDFIKSTPGFPSKVKVVNAHLDRCSKETISAKQQSTPQPKVQNVDGHQGRPSWEAPTHLKRPITSLQALRKLGILAKRSHADFTSQESLGQQGPAMAPSALGDLSQSSEQGSQATTTSSLVPPSASSDFGSQAILMRHLEKRKKLVFRSCSKPENPTLGVPSRNELVKGSIVWRGGLRQGQTEPQSGFGQFSETRSVTGFELPRHRGA